MDKDFTAACPAPFATHDRVVLAHGGGGRAMHRLIEGMLGAFDNEALAARHDGAVVGIGTTRLAVSTDSYVVRPMFFPGGDIGKLAVYGTVNDVAMCGARPRWLSVGLVLEEGTPLETLGRVVESMRRAALATGVAIVTGDTKVVERGKGDHIFVHTTGIGVVEHALRIEPASVRAGDAVLLSGDIGRHGMAIMAAREGLAFESDITSDCAPLAAMVQGLLGRGLEVHCLRDCTRGGVTSALVEIAEAAHLELELDEAAVPVHEDVRAACELFGLDPLYVANEGRLVCFVPEREAEAALAALRADPSGTEAAIVGRVTGAGRGTVTVRSRYGTARALDMLNGEQLPRIC
ncbi:MAG: hydrogenase expression/formation protein HypE [Polyangiaceae bacterium]|nr:hydrogenase expression/formation protein HypE [Polyangiaceae bacterium]